MQNGRVHSSRRQIAINALTIGFILVELTLVWALMSPGVKELVYAGF